MTNPIIPTKQIACGISHRDDRENYLFNNVLHPLPSPHDSESCPTFIEKHFYGANL